MASDFTHGEALRTEIAGNLARFERVAIEPGELRLAAVAMGTKSMTSWTEPEESRPQPVAPSSSQRS